MGLSFIGATICLLSGATWSTEQCLAHIGADIVVPIDQQGGETSGLPEVRMSRTRCSPIFLRCSASPARAGIYIARMRWIGGETLIGRRRNFGIGIDHRRQEVIDLLGERTINLIIDKRSRRRYKCLELLIS
jgi:hypothetical protein